MSDSLSLLQLLICHRQGRVRTRGPGFTEITADVRAFVERSGIREGACALAVGHTSASLVIQENADPSVRRDLERFLRRLVPEASDWEHDAEGPDDMPGHVRAALLPTTLTLPVIEGAPRLGRWQGIYVWEHRARPHAREVAMSAWGVRGAARA